MRKINFALVDNNYLQREITHEMMEEYLQKTSYLYNIRSFASGNELLDEVKRNGLYDVYIMETSMPDAHGIKIAEELRRLGDEGIIVFLTKDIANAYQAFKVRALDYILKPLTKEKLKAAMDNMLLEISRKNLSPIVDIKFKTGLMRVPINNIKYIDIIDRALCFHLKNGENLQTKCLRSNFREELENIMGIIVDMTKFTFAGASCFINIEYIMKVSNGEVLLKTGEQIQVPRTAISTICAAWRKYML